MAEAFPTRARNAYYELIETVRKVGLAANFPRGVPLGQFAEPWIPRTSPICPVFSYAGRQIPGAVLLESFTRAEKRRARFAEGTRSMIPCGVMIHNPAGRGVRRHLVVLELPDLLRLLVEADRVPPVRGD